MEKKYRFIYLIALFGHLVIAEEWSLGGHIKYHLAATHYKNDHLNVQYGPQAPLDNFFELRLTAENRWGAWDSQIHYEILTLYGDTPERQNKLPDEIGLSAMNVNLPTDNHRLFKLTDEWEGSEKWDAVQRLDRLFIGYNGEKLVMRFGRQAVSWGNGLIFHPLDIFSPFSPTAIDKDYKTGDDMLYGQYLFDSGDDLQMILLPRRNPKNNKVESEQSSLAFKYHGRYQEQWDFDLNLARHFDENVFGFGLSKDVLEAIWRFDITATRPQYGGTAISLMSNLDYSWVWFERNFYGYIEYFHNGVGETQTEHYLHPDPALQTRLERGEVYTWGSDYLASGIQIELTPLFNFYTSWLANLHDNSGLFQIRGIYDWAEDLQLIAWLDMPYGKKGSEFGGIPMDSSNTHLAPGKRAYLRLTYYF